MLYYDLDKNSGSHHPFQHAKRPAARRASNVASCVVRAAISRKYDEGHHRSPRVN